MRDRTSPSADSTSGVTPRVPWRVAQVRALAGHRLEVTFLDGTRGEVDLSHLVHGPQAGVFAVLRDPDVFAQVHLVRGAVTWPGGLDLAPDAMYDEIKARGFWTL